jgi:hypothetical protein
VEQLKLPTAPNALVVHHTPSFLRASKCVSELIATGSLNTCAMIATLALLAGK